MAAPFPIFPSRKALFYMAIRLKKRLKKVGMRGIMSL